MKYYPPIGSADPNAPYVDDNPAAGQEGSAVPAKAVEHPQREIQAVIEAAGLTPDENQIDQLNEAIDTKISLAVGGESQLDEVINLLRARARVYPEILTASGTFNLLQPTGSSVRIPAGINLLHRGCFLETTAQQDFSHVANKVYHLRKRWTGTPGWSLVDVSDPGYNPSALAEGNVAFDTDYDDMVSHRIVTDASNVATITPLVNKDRLLDTKIVAGTNFVNPNTSTTTFDILATYNWARAPKNPSLVMARQINGNSMQRENYGVLGTSAAALLAASLPVLDCNRYRVQQTYLAFACTDAAVTVSVAA